MMIPHVSESLAGRVELLQMWPLAQSELEGTHANFLARAFSTGSLAASERPQDRDAILERALRGGYPEAIQRSSRARRVAWFGSYITTVVQREIRSISAIDDNASVVRVLRGLASRSGQPRNVAGLAHDIGIPASTVTRHIELLKATFLVAEIPAWSGSVDGRVVRSPKLLLTDSGLYGYLLNLTASDQHAGFLLESFVGAELLKLISFAANGAYTLLHFRSTNQREVDFVIERADRTLVAIEVKSTTSPTQRDFNGIDALAQSAGNRFHRGFVLHCGNATVPFGRDRWAVPISTLWHSD